jgi:hypothetical protein
MEFPSQDVISRDNVSMKVDAVLYFNVVNPERAITHGIAYCEFLRRRNCGVPRASKTGSPHFELCCATGSRLQQLPP